MVHQSDDIRRQLAKSSLYPQESLLEVSRKPSSLFIGVPKEHAHQESRVGLTPDAVGLLTNSGHEVWIETSAGIEAKFSDNEYSEAGAKIVYSHEEIFKADVILKIEPPTDEEFSFIKPGRTLISALQLGHRRADYFKKICDKKLTAIGFELIEDKVGGAPLVRAMSEIAGSTVMLIAAEYLSNGKDGQGIILGGVTGVAPAEVVILGAGTVAEHAGRAALGLGANIKVFDNEIYRLRRLKHALNQQVFTSVIDAATLEHAVQEADVLIGAIRAQRGRARHVVSEEMVSGMKKGAVIIDVSIDQGGCVETTELTTHRNPVFTKYGVIHYGVPNIASRVSRSATYALSNIFTPMLLQSGDLGGMEEMVFANKWFMKGVYAYKGNLTNAYIGSKFSLRHKDLELFRAARI